MMPYPQYIDTHSHLNHPSFKGDWFDIARRAVANDVWMIIVGYDYESSRRAVEMAEHFPIGVYASVGVHPRFISGNRGMDSFEKIVKHPKVVAIGETGLDFTMPQESHYPQRIMFERFIRLAQENRLPLILQDHDAHESIVSHLKENKVRNPGAEIEGLVHHFKGNIDHAARYKLHGFIPTITNLLVQSHVHDNKLNNFADNDFVVESECVHLVDDEMTRSRPDPQYLANSIDSLAASRGIPSKEFSQLVRKNALRLFPKIIHSMCVGSREFLS